MMVFSYLLVSMTFMCNLSLSYSGLHWIHFFIVCIIFKESLYSIWRILLHATTWMAIIGLIVVYKRRICCKHLGHFWWFEFQGHCCCFVYSYVGCGFHGPVWGDWWGSCEQVGWHVLLCLIWHARPIVHCSTWSYWHHPTLPWVGPWWSPFFTFTLDFFLFHFR